MFKPGTKFKVVDDRGMSGWSRAKKADHVFEVGDVTVSYGKTYLYPKLTTEEAESFFCGTTDVCINVEGVEIVKEDKRHKHADVIIAWLNGDSVEFRSNCNENWENLGLYVEGAGIPGFYEDWEYRVKPKTKTVWYNLYSHRPGNGYYDTEAEAKSISSGIIATLSVEVPV